MSAPTLISALLDGAIPDVWECSGGTPLALPLLAAQGDAAWRELAAGPRLVLVYPTMDEIQAETAEGAEPISASPISWAA